MSCTHIPILGNLDYRMMNVERLFEQLDLFQVISKCLYEMKGIIIKLSNISNCSNFVVEEDIFIQMDIYYFAVEEGMFIQMDIYYCATIGNNSLLERNHIRLTRIQNAGSALCDDV